MKRRMFALVVLAASVLLMAASCPFLEPDDVPAVNQAPVAQFTTSPISGQSPLSVSFDASGSYDLDGTI